MTTRKNKDDEVLMAPKLAAQYLAGRLGESPELWQYRLANWRRPGRSGPVVAHSTPAGGVVYVASELDNYARQKAAAVAVVTGLADGDSVRCGALAKLDSTTAAHVRVTFAIGSVSQAVYAIAADDARRLATQLVKAAEAVEQQQRVKA